MMRHERNGDKSFGWKVRVAIEVALAGLWLVAVAYLFYIGWTEVGQAEADRSWFRQAAECSESQVDLNARGCRLTLRGKGFLGGDGLVIDVQTVAQRLRVSRRDLLHDRMAGLPEGAPLLVAMWHGAVIEVWSPDLRSSMTRFHPEVVYDRAGRSLPLGGILLALGVLGLGWRLRPWLEHLWPGQGVEVTAMSPADWSREWALNTWLFGWPLALIGFSLSSLARGRYHDFSRYEIPYSLTLGLLLTVAAEFVSIFVCSKFDGRSFRHRRRWAHVSVALMVPLFFGVIHGLAVLF